MANSSKIFIYNSQGSFQESVNDLKELFTNENIFAQRPDVRVCDFNFNVKGLSTPTFVVPGGSTTAIGKRLKPQLEHIRSLIGENFNYVGVCAGAFVATSDANLFFSPHTIKETLYQLEEQDFFLTTKQVNANVSMINDYNAIGSFYPTDVYVGSTPKQYMPYRVTLSLIESGDILPQLYVAGPGFAKVDERQQTTVVATYTDREQYTFPCPTENKEIPQLPAMIRSMPTENKGGVFLTGAHIETCIRDSQLLTFFKTPGKLQAALKSNEFESFIDEQQEVKIKVESLLRNTLK